MKLSSNNDYSNKFRGVVDDYLNLPASLTSKNIKEMQYYLRLANLCEYDPL